MHIVQLQKIYDTDVLVNHNYEILYCNLYTTGFIAFLFLSPLSKHGYLLYWGLKITSRSKDLEHMCLANFSFFLFFDNVDKLSLFYPVCPKKLNNEITLPDSGLWLRSIA